MLVKYKDTFKLGQMVKAHASDAGFDIRSAEDLTIPPGEFRQVHTGLYLELPALSECQIRPRSGLAARSGITVLNSPGTVDAGYRGEVCVLLINHGKQPFQVTRGDRIAQLVLYTLPEVRTEKLEDTEVLEETDRSGDGFGSTGLR